MASNNSQIHKPGHGHPKRAKLPDININTSVQIIDTERASLSCPHMNFQLYPKLFQQSCFLNNMYNNRRFQVYCLSDITLTGCPQSAETAGSFHKMAFLERVSLLHSCGQAVAISMFQLALELKDGSYMYMQLEHCIFKRTIEYFVMCKVQV